MIADNTSQATKDPSWIDASGRSKQRLIEGVKVYHSVVHADDRGTLMELYNPAWGLHPLPLVYLYEVTVRVGITKGWHQHHLRDDRLHLIDGTVMFVLYDPREDSPTFGMVNEITISHKQRGMVIIPTYVWHALHNPGETEARLISMPTATYDYEDPDVYRLPLENDVLPYQWRVKPIGY